MTVVAKSPIGRTRQVARDRGWRHLRLLSSANNTYNHGETPEGDQIPALNVFARRGGRIHHFYNMELLYAPTEPSQDGRHFNLIWPLWNLLRPDAGRPRREVVSAAFVLTVARRVARPVAPSCPPDARRARVSLVEGTGPAP